MDPLKMVNRIVCVCGHLLEDHETPDGLFPCRRQKQCKCYGWQYSRHFSTREYKPLTLADNDSVQRYMARWSNG